MKIIILGAGQVGSSVARSLAGESNDITVVDQRQELLKGLLERLDIRTVNGYASHPDVLVRAGIEDADLILAVTNSDEINMIACHVAHTLFNTPMRLARVREDGYLAYQKLFSSEHIPVNYIISPEQLVTTFFKHIIEHPGVLQILDFAGGRAQLVAVRAHKGGPLIGRELNSLQQVIPQRRMRVVAIYRRGRAVVPDGDNVIETDDEVFFLAAPKDIPHVVAAFRRSDKPNRRVIIAGGGNIGMQLAEQIESSFHVKVIEQNHSRCGELASKLHKSVILHGDAADETLLREEDIAETDVYCALTDDDEANILSSMLAKRMGVRKVITLINRPSYVDLAQDSSIDIAVSPQLVTIGALLAHVRRGDVVSVHSLRRGAAEAIEAIAHGDAGNSKVVGRAISELNLPVGTVVGGIVRGDELILPHNSTVIESEDHVILFLADKRKVLEVERLFQVGVTFM